MAKAVKISDEVKGVTSCELRDILACFDGSKFHWSILHIWATGDLGSQFSAMDLEEVANNAPKGFPLSWHDLKHLAKKFDQVIDLLLVGCRDPRAIMRFNTDEEMYEKCELVIEMIDSSYWIIHSHSDELVEKVSCNFRDTSFL